MDERDHRHIAKQQELLMFHELSPGSAFWLPHGTRIYKKLMELIQDQYKKRGYQEVISPNMYKLDLFEKSGHIQHYREDMFCLDVDDQKWALKPMNCPGHCLIFSSCVRSHNDLPLRLADFGVLHRNEMSGALRGLLRARRFQQDDAHIFCRADQIQSEVFGVLEFMRDIYDKFGMRYELALSSKPDKAIGGDDALWERAEADLSKALDNFAGKGNWNLNPGDGAFYGPKIDVKIMDAMGRPHQCASIQLDFQLPQADRLNLKYKSGSNVKGEEYSRPVIIHRAILGSVERMFAVLCEHYNGNWPFWLSPRQVMVVPIHAGCIAYCHGVKDRLEMEGFYVDLDPSSQVHFKQKIGNALKLKYNFLFVVGNSEEGNGSVNVRARGDPVAREMKLDDAIDMLNNLK
jgi:threonyl-tRNA synthetase